MTDQPAITRIDNVDRPNRPEYQRYIDVWYTNGARVRHVVDEHGRYFEQAFDPDDPDTVWDDIVVEENFDPEQLDGYVTTWLDVTTDQNVDPDSFPLPIVTGNESASATNVRYE